MTEHPDFTAAPPERRWTKPLNELASQLRLEAVRARGVWVWYVLPHGALVAMRAVLHEATRRFRKELRLARREAPADEKTKAARAREIATFRRYLDVEGWTLARDDGREVVLVESIEPVRAPTEERCADCGAPCEKGPHVPLRCTACAVKAGERFAQEKAKA